MRSSTRSFPEQMITRRGLFGAFAGLALFPAARRALAHETGEPIPGAHGGQGPGAPSVKYVRSNHRYNLPNVPLVGKDGAPTSLSSALDTDNPVMVNFIFTTCTTICPVMSAVFSQVEAEFGAGRDRIRLVSFSIDPEHDTPVRLREYAKKFDAGPEWRFYTGTAANLIAVQKAFHAYNGNKMNHTLLTLLRAGRDATWVRLDGLASAQDLAREVRTALLAAR